MEKKDFKYEILGIGFNELVNVEDNFDLTEDFGDRRLYESKKTYTHEEEGLTFDYKYVIECGCDDEYEYYEIGLSVMPKSCCKKFIEECMEDACIEDEDSLTLYDVFYNGASTVSFGFIRNENTGQEWDEDTINKLASIVDFLDIMRGFYLDKAWNQICTTGWDTIKHCVKGEALF